MENNNKYKKIIIILSVILVVLLLAFGGLYLYRKFVVLKGIERTNVPIQHGVVDTNKKEEKVTLDEEDVKKWLSSHQLVEWEYILKEMDFDYNTATSKEYGQILYEYLISQGEEIMIDSKILGEDSISKYGEYYSNEYIYNLSSAKEMLNDYFGVEIDKIDVNVINETYKGYANMSIENGKIYIRVKSYDGYNNKNSELNKISLNNDNNIVVNYTLKECIAVEEKVGCNMIGNREIVLKKTDNGYNILKAYKVEN